MVSSDQLLPPAQSKTLQLPQTWLSLLMLGYEEGIRVPAIWKLPSTTTNWSDILQSKSVLISFITHLFEKHYGPKVLPQKALFLYFCLPEARFYLLFKRNIENKEAWLKNMRG